MEVYTTEQEQIEQIKRWWKEYGKTILFTTIFVLVASYAWRSWQGHEQKRFEKASLNYSVMLNHLQRDGVKTALPLAQQIINLFPKTPYASLSAFFLAKNDINQGAFKQAETQLMWVVNHGKQDDLRQLARVREARLLLNDKQYNNALTMLKPLKKSLFASSVAELRGDIYSAQGQLKKARDAYEHAYAVLPKQAEHRLLLSMKIARTPIERGNAS